VTWPEYQKAGEGWQIVPPVWHPTLSGTRRSGSSPGSARSQHPQWGQWTVVDHGGGSIMEGVAGVWLLDHLASKGWLPGAGDAPGPMGRNQSALESLDTRGQRRQV
jgi:hypothetical protein